MAFDRADGGQRHDEGGAAVLAGALERGLAADAGDKMGQLGSVCLANTSRNQFGRVRVEPARLWWIRSIEFDSPTLAMPSEPNTSARTS